ncbi:MAG: acyl-CoA dehydrogenase, partial [Candidatus Marinamargulisbacteria bacterium]
MSEIIYNLRLFFDFSPTELGVTAFFLILILGFRGTKLRTWTVLTGIFLLLMEVDLAVWYVFGGLVAFNIAPLRRILVSNLVFYVIGKLNFVPKISETERIALEAGTVWVEGEFFSGKPDFKRVFSEDYPSLSVEEQAFLDGPAETLCSMVDDWEVHQNRGFSDEVWAYMKDNGFFGMIIPKKYGGLEFSAVAHGAIIAKLSARCSPLGITVMVPNSLGPGELINHYGTDAQRDYYLPRLAKGQDIPCFGLTEPDAGSDAGAMTSRGDLFKGDDGKLYIRLNWKKRYITLSGLSSIIGLAFKLYDPEKLLGKSDSFGITCALVPSDAAGVVLGRYHDPLGIPFCNCPTEGHDVVISADAIIGGVERAGSGWKMLMESLATGRGISLPATCAGGSKLVTKVVSAYTAVRKQFGVSIGQFEGIESPLSRISGMTYIIESASRFTCGAIDRGVKPSVVSAIIKYHTTEMLRTVINDGMDVLGGKAISRGPKNLLAHPYFGIPVGITVEGANILTRTLIIFGQGAIRCHPFALKQVNAIESGDKKAFDLAFWGHAGHV